MGVVGLRSRVTGLRAISIIEEITFMPGCQASSNSSQRGWSWGEAWRRILKTTNLELVIGNGWFTEIFKISRACPSEMAAFTADLVSASDRHPALIFSRPGRNQAHVDPFEFEFWL